MRPQRLIIELGLELADGMLAVVERIANNRPRQLLPAQQRADVLRASYAAEGQQGEARVLLHRLKEHRVETLAFPLPSRIDHQHFRNSLLRQQPVDRFRERLPSAAAMYEVLHNPIIRGHQW